MHSVASYRYRSCLAPTVCRASGKGAFPFPRVFCDESVASSSFRSKLIAAVEDSLLSLHLFLFVVASTLVCCFPAIIMAKKKSNHEERSTASANDAPTIQGYVEDELELLQVDLGDMVKMKQVLDEAVVLAVNQHVEEEYSWDNRKLMIMFAACVSACVAQFVPIPFPESRPILGLCGAIYFLLSGVLQFITTFMDKDAILLTKPVVDAPKTNTDMKKYGLRIRSQLPRFSEWYTVIVQFQRSNDTSAVSPYVEQTWSVGQFFDKEGYFDEVGLTQRVDQLLERFKAGKFDDEASKSKKD